MEATKNAGITNTGIIGSKFGIPTQGQYPTTDAEHKRDQRRNEDGAKLTRVVRRKPRPAKNDSDGGVYQA